MSDTGNASNCDNKPQQEEVILEESQAPVVSEVENKPVTPVKRTPSKRLTAVERAQRESEELVKTLGGSLDIEGGRKTRSSTRGTPSKSSVVHTPPPTKRARGSGTPKRGRGRKLETAIEDEVKTSPEKTPSEPEAIENSTVVDATKTEDKVEDTKSETTAISSEIVEESTPAAKQDDDKPEPMEVDGVSKDIAATETDKPAEESVQNESQSPAKPIVDEVEKSDKVNDEAVATNNDDSKPIEKAADPPVATDEEKQPALADKIVEAPSKSPAHENNVEAVANDLKVNSNSSPVKGDVLLAAQTPATPVPAAAGNEHKAENNEICEPKIASPPITANNDSATPQYCN